MKRLLLLGLLIVIGIFSPNITNKVNAEEPEKPTDYLVVFKENINKNIIINNGGTVEEEYNNFPAIKAQFFTEPTFLLNNPEIDFIEKDSAVRAYNTTKNVDTSLEKNSLNKKIKKYGLTGKNVSVAILDTGVDLDHPDLDVKGGISFIDNTPDYDDDNGHGTHLAGIVSANDNKVGITGIAPDIDLFSVKVLDSQANGKYSTVVKGIDWAIENNIRIVLMSLGGTVESEFFKEAMEKAYKHGIVLVASVGNRGYIDADTVTYPAKYETVLGVGALDKENKRAFLSSRGKGIDFMAPGVDIISTSTDNAYDIDSGTSFAAAHVIGLIALMLEKAPTVSNDVLISTMKSTATNLGDPFEYGNGQVNLKQTLKKLKMNR